MRMPPTAERVMVDNTLSPHGGSLVERVMPANVCRDELSRMKTVEVRGQIARECVNICYGFFSPLEGFMVRDDLESVTAYMRLASGYVWSIPIVFDASYELISELSLSQGESLLLTYQGEPLATLDVEEIYSYDKQYMGLWSSLRSQVLGKGPACGYGGEGGHRAERRDG